MILLYAVKLCGSGSPSLGPFLSSKIRHEKGPPNQTLPGLDAPSALGCCHILSPEESFAKAFRKFYSRRGEKR